VTVSKNSPAALPSPEVVRSRLDALRSERGYLLPHHGALAAAAPDLHEAYGTMYSALTLTERHLDPLEKEFIWLVLLTALQESVGTHHLELFRRAGGSDAQAKLAFRLAGYAAGAQAFTFVDKHWSSWFPGLNPVDDYLDSVRRLHDGSVADQVVDLAMVALHAALGQESGVAAHIRSAYAAAASEDKLVEALTLIIWPAGVNRFVEACTVWHELMRTGAVTPSPRFQAWADTPGQGAFEPAKKP
jgi:hypothetical protein